VHANQAAGGGLTHPPLWRGLPVWRRQSRLFLTRPHDAYTLQDLWRVAEAIYGQLLRRREHGALVLPNKAGAISKN